MKMPYYTTLPFSLVLFFSSLENHVIHHSPMKGQQENPASLKTFHSNQILCNRGKCSTRSTHLGIFPPKTAGFQAGTPGLPATRARIVFTFLFYIFRRNFSFYLTALFYFSTKWKNFCLLHNRKYHWL